MTISSLSAGTKYGGFICLGPNPNVKLEHNDVVCYGGCLPDMVQSHDYNNHAGFIVNNSAGRTLQWMLERLVSSSVSDVSLLTFWRKTKEPIKRCYEPSFWAKPVPLP